MSTRLQVVMDHAELDRYRRRAALEGLPLSEWVRRVLQRAVVEDSEDRVTARLAAIDRALQCEHPTGDIDEILGDIERGRDFR